MVLERNKLDKIYKLITTKYLFIQKRARSIMIVKNLPG